jgi:ATPase subunit of ABC transporter with duplicated ATPase domains
VRPSGAARRGAGDAHARVRDADEPTNHLDLEACVWLEGYLKTYNKCLVMVSHSQDFLNGVCTHIIWLTHQKLTYFTGNYDTFCKTVAENEVIQMKKHQKEQEGAWCLLSALPARSIDTHGYAQTSST